MQAEPNDTRCFSHGKSQDISEIRVQGDEHSPLMDRQRANHRIVRSAQAQLNDSNGIMALSTHANRVVDGKVFVEE